MKYRVPANKGTASVRSIVNVRADATTPQRGKMNDYSFGSVTTPADNVFDHELLRSSTAPTGGTVTPSPNDPADAASLFDAMDTITADPTFGAVLFRCALNMRASFRWVAAPGDELIWPATANNGITGALAAATTTDFSASVGVDAS